MYAASVNENRLTFEVYGVWRKNMVMNDCQTGSIWQHATGEALAGPLAGAQLEVLPGWETTWGELRIAYPHAVYAQEPERFTGLMPKAFLMRALQVTHVARLDGLSPLDNRLDAHAVVIGVALHGAAKAYPLTALRTAGVVQDEVGGVSLRLQYHPHSERVTVQTEAGQPLPFQRQWWLGWSEFYPRSAVYGDKQT